MKTKSEVSSIIFLFTSLVQNQFGNFIKCLRLDNGKEFELTNFYNKNGIVHQLSCIGTLQQNGVVQRKHQHILGVARALRLRSNMPLKF